jgi:hypothetical protein
VLDGKCGLSNIGNVRRRCSLANVLHRRIVPVSPAEDFPAHLLPQKIAASRSLSAILIRSICRVLTLKYRTSMDLSDLQSLVWGRNIHVQNVESVGKRKSL